MLNTKLALFHELCWKAAHHVGYSAPAITDAVLNEAFPETERAATKEGALEMLRDGVLAAVRKLLKSQPDERQIDLGDIVPQFREIVKRCGLKKARYYVPSLGRYVDLKDLIAHHIQLDEARRFLRQKGEECIAEANRLDELYEAVMAAAG